MNWRENMWAAWLNRKKSNSSQLFCLLNSVKPLLFKSIKSRIHSAPMVRTQKYVTVKNYLPKRATKVYLTAQRNCSSTRLKILERLRMTFTANGKRVRYEHLTMFILYLPLAVFSFSVKSSSSELASKATISLHYSHLCTLNFKKT